MRWTHTQTLSSTPFIPSDNWGCHRLCRVSRDSRFATKHFVKWTRSHTHTHRGRRWRRVTYYKMLSSSYRSFVNVNCCSLQYIVLHATGSLLIVVDFCEPIFEKKQSGDDESERKGRGDVVAAAGFFLSFFTISMLYWPRIYKLIKAVQSLTSAQLTLRQVEIEIVCERESSAIIRWHFWHGRGCVHCA